MALDIASDCLESLFEAKFLRDQSDKIVKVRPGPERTDSLLRPYNRSIKAGALGDNNYCFWISTNSVEEVNLGNVGSVLQLPIGL